jgi:hypothetical protein
LDIAPRGKRQAIEGMGNRLQVFVGEMQVDQSVFQTGVCEQDLDGAQVGSGVPQMGGAGVAQTVWGQAFADTGKLGCLATSQPDDVGGDGGVGAFTGKQIGVGLSPAPVEGQGFQQFGSEWNIAIAAALPVNADHHALTIEVTDLERAKFGPWHGGGIQGHEQGAVIEIACRIDEPGYFLRAED